MKKCVITTTINEPTEALKKFSQMEGWDLIVVGDKKTPHSSYNKLNCVYLTPEYQELNFKELSDLIGWNCIQRRNLGFVYAFKQGYNLFATVDDDNEPLDNWFKNNYLSGTKLIKVVSDDLVVDPIFNTEYDMLWHRGFPLQLIHNRYYHYEWVEESGFDIQANFWNGDPDIDAICRMIHKPECDFADHNFPFFTEQYSPFNSQNTILRRSVMSHYFMFPHVGRMDDIWASYYVESLGFQVVYGEATVYQKRNEHDLTKDMVKEYDGYQYNLKLVEELDKDPDNIKNFIPERSWLAFKEYQRIMNG